MQDGWDDQALYRGLLAKDARALEALMGRYSRELTYFVRMVMAGVGTAQDAEECVSDLFMTVWDEIEDFDPRRGAFGAWLSMRGKYLALDRRRSILRRVNVVQYVATGDNSPQSVYSPAANASSGASAAESSLDGVLEQRERHEELRKALEELPELDRLLVYLRYFRLASTEEIAARTGLTRRAIDTRLWRTRKNLRDALGTIEEQAHGQVRVF